MEKWKEDEYFKPLSEISKPDVGAPLVNISENIFCFDSISEKIYQNNKPCSVDGLFFSRETAYLVEFKTGFKKKITRENYCDERVLCPKHNHICKDYKNLFFKKSR